MSSRGPSLIGNSFIGCSLGTNTLWYIIPCSSNVARLNLSLHRSYQMPGRSRSAISSPDDGRRLSLEARSNFRRRPQHMVRSVGLPAIRRLLPSLPSIEVHAESEREWDIGAATGPRPSLVPHPPLRPSNRLAAARLPPLRTDSIQALSTGSIWTRSCTE